MSIQDRQTALVGAAATLWTSAMAFAVAGSVIDSRRILFWAGFLGLVACGLSNYVITAHLLRRERLRVEHLVDGLIAAAERRSDVSQLHR